ncbi:NifB/NifX family molybdenum-iron cluster-binding protein [Thermovirga sp.]|uniref:NifB/NifX family molybdenum-iron cluster-binding protein n=1 Tax=Thermovirga sp. TaxID=2699834 RepID=UPI0025EB8034|nr:NifB/NifX family molybdenum-iron cluster-binding protein [Thermovirga sp.]MBO8153877.1 NifB/NifX family molybdenum-iron cluster-binding protein [Thermovirga sp.]
MKIAVAMENGNVCEHFGHAPSYAIFTIQENKIVEKEELANPGHTPGFLPKWMASFGVDAIIAGGMGPRAVQLFKEQGITPVIGAKGPVEEVVQKYCEGTLQTGPSACDHH